MSILLADRILAAKGFPLELFPIQEKSVAPSMMEYGRLLKQDIAESVVFTASEIARYYEERFQKDGKTGYLFANFRLPFPKVFVEFHPLAGNGLLKSGVVFRSEDFGFPEEAKAEISQHPAWEGLDLNWEHLNASPEDRLFHITATAIATKDNEYFTPIAESRFLVSPKGGLYIDQIVTTLLATKEDTPRRYVLEFYLQLILPAVLAVSFMNCKNIRMVDNEPSKKLSKAFQRRNGRPLLTYKTLEIEPMKKVLETEGEIGKNGLRKALHICRGHFATYTPEKGMLGRPLEENVTVWKPAHVRGNAKEGVVVKDYKVKAPK